MSALFQEGCLLKSPWSIPALTRRKNIRSEIGSLLAVTGSSPLSLEYHELVFHEAEGTPDLPGPCRQGVDADLIIFLSRHSSEHPLPVLTVHVTGNIGPARLGGVAGSLAVASPPWMHAVLCSLERMHRKDTRQRTR